MSDAGRQRRTSNAIGLASLMWGVAISALPLSSSARATASSFDVLTDPVSLRAGVEVLNGYLRPLSPTVEVAGCPLLLARYPGTTETIYAGVCRLRSGAQVMVCGDTAVGEFGLTPTGTAAGPKMRDLLARFADANCPGG